MSNSLAVATVTAALRQSLQAAVARDLDGATVTTRRPGGSSSPPSPSVNVYLYQATPNPAWRNADLPSRNGDGQTIRRPRAALDLHYLLTFYGEEGKLEPERLLGIVVQRLHEHPVLTPGIIREAIDAGARQGDFLAGSDLAEESERVKFTPGALSLEELSKLWSIFFQTPYVLSVAYQGTVVLIDGTETPRPALPVRSRRLDLSPFRRPTIEAIVPADGADQPVSVDSLLRIRGSALAGEGMRVLIGIVELPVTKVTEVSDNEIVASLASAIAGVQGVQVVHSRVWIEGTEERRQDIPSNAVALVLQPAVEGVAFATRRVGREEERTIEVTVRPAVGPEQRVALLLRKLGGDDAPFYTLEPRPLEAATATVEFPAAVVAPGQYLAVIQVDGAESVLELAIDSRGPTVEVPVPKGKSR